MSYGFLNTRTIPPPHEGEASPKLIGSMTSTIVTPWVPVWMVPNAFFVQIEGTSGTVTAGGRFEFSDDGVNLAGKGSTLSLSGTGAGVGEVVDADCDKSISPWTPWKFVRFNCTAISGTGAKVTAKQALGS